jgi:spermidine/putrescine transport system substrate-binding protein
MDNQRFLDLVHDLERGRISRRHFLKVTGLATAAAVVAANGPRGAFAQSPGPYAAWTPPAGADLGSELIVTTWPNYHAQATLDAFRDLTGVTVQLNPLGSNEEMLAQLLVGGTGWDVLVPTNYTFETYGSTGILEPLDLAKLPNLDTSRLDPLLLSPAYYPAGSETLYGFNKDWGTTGFTVNTAQVPEPPASWQEFFERTQQDLSGKVLIHDYQLTSIGSALVALGYSFNSVDEKELADAEALLMAVKPHLFGITSDYQPGMRNGDAWMSMTWTNDGAQLHRDIPEIVYVLGSDGGEIWSDFFAVVAGSAHRDAAYAFLDFMAVPAVAAADAAFHGAGLVDSAAIALLPADVRENPITYPDAASLSPLEFGTAELLTNPARADLWARVKSA